MQHKATFLILNLLLLTFLVSCQSNPEKIVLSPRSAMRGISSEPTLHAIIVADTNDITARTNTTSDFMEIGDSVTVDLRNMKELIADIQKNTGLRLNQQTIYGDDFDYQQITDALNILSVSDQDVVFFYYAGHGVNRANGSRWPSMVIGNHLLDLKQVTSTLQSKDPRFFIAMADACNEIVEKFRGLKQRGRDRGLKPKTENYQRLFLQQQGYVMVSSTGPDQNASGDEENGGLFTHKFLVTLDETLASPDPSWRGIATEMGKPIQHKHGQQDAQFDIKIKQVEEPSITTLEEDDREDETVTIQESALAVRLLPTTRFQVGQEMQVQITNQSNESGYLFVWDINSNGQLVRILPNDDAQKYYLGVGQTIKIPENRYAGFSLTMVEPLGQGFIVAVLVNSDQKQAVLTGNIASISGTQAQSAFQTLQTRLNAILKQSVSVTKVKYEIF